ncbi:MAG: pilus assembly protein TadG-related protein [Thermoguttaceae bacterium]
MSHRRRFGNSRRGVVSVLAALLIAVLLGMVALSVDIGKVCVVQTQAQAVADAAALAGARGLSVSAAQVQSLATSCAQANTVNGKAVVLPSSNIVLGTWNTTARTFTALTGSSQSQANACQVTVSLTSAGGNPVNMFFAPAIGVKTANVTASAIAGAGRWDVVVACDITSSFNDDLSQAVAGMQTILSDLNQYSPTSNLGIVTFNGQGWTNASLQPVGTNYAALKTAIGNIKDCASGGPACSGSDLAAGMATAISLFSASTYQPPLGTRKAVIFISDGAANIGSGCVNKKLSDNADNALAATEANNAWTSQGISVYSLLYYHGSDDETDIGAMQALIQGTGQYIQEPSAAQLTTDLESMLMNNLSMQLVQ